MSNLGKRPMTTESGSSSGGSKRKGKGTPNRRWTKEMDDVLIPCLADMARAGLKVDKSFKRQAFVEAASIVNRRFPSEKMDADNVENHMRILTIRYQEIKKLMNLSGVGWNDELKMLVMEEETYRTYIESHPKARDLLNKPIHNFEELRLICGDDQATGQFTRSIFKQFGVGDNEEINEGNNETDPGIEIMDTTPSENETQPQETQRVSSTTPNNSRGSRSSKASFDITMEEIAKGVGDLSCTLREAKKHWIESLSAVLFAMDDEFDEDDLDRLLKYCATMNTVRVGLCTAGLLCGEDG